MKKPIFLISVLFLAATGARADGNTCTWIGGSGNWSDAANWQGGNAPQELDDVLFPNTSSITVNVDVAGVYLRTLSSTGSGTSVVAFKSENGMTVRLKSCAVTQKSVPFEFLLPLVFPSDATFSAVVGADGVAPVVASQVSFEAGSKVSVDLSACGGGRRSAHLVDTRNLSADFTKIQTTFTDDSGRKFDQGARLVAATNGLYAAISARGLVLTVYADDD